MLSRSNFILNFDFVAFIHFFIKEKKIETFFSYRISAQIKAFFASFFCSGPETKDSFLFYE